MANKMLIDATHPEETRVVVVRGNRVEEFDYESATRKQLRGNIYLAKVTRVEPSLQAAFVEYGGNRHGFLAFSEIHPDYYQIPVADRLALLEEEERAARLAEDEDEVREKRRDRGRSRRNGQGGSGARDAEAGTDEDAVLSDAAETFESTEGQTLLSVAEALEEAPAYAQAPRPVAEEASAEVAVVETQQTEHVAEQPSPAVEVKTDNDATVAVDAPASELSAPEAVASGDAGSEDTSAEDAAGDTSGQKAQPFPARVDAVTSEAAPTPEEDAARQQAEADESESRLTAEAAEAEENLAGDEPEDSARIEAEVEAALDDLPEAPAQAKKSASSDINDEEDEDDGDIEQIDEDDEIEHLGSDDDAMEEVPERSYQRRAKSYKIQEVIRRRQVMLVQVVKEERGNKGAALTTYLSLAGRYSVLMPNTARGGGISRKITNAADRKRLKEVVQELEVPEGMGIILRTAGANRTKTEIKRDFEYLLRLWETVRELTLSSAAPSLVYEEGSLIKRAIRDLYNKDIDEVIVAGEDGYREARDFMRMLMPSHAKIVQPYRDPQPIYARYGVEQQLDAMFSPVVQLKSGGYIVINPTEALVSIDVNSGRATREHHIEDTALKTNVEAAEEIARQLRLRDLAGLIVVDFIDMEEKRNNRAVERKLKDCLKDDRARIQLGRISHFGLLEMSRQRIRTGVLESSIEVCPHCGGTGHVRSAASVALQLLRAMEEQLLRSASHNLNARARTEVALYVLNQKRSHLRELEDRFGVNINILADDDVTGHHPFLIDKGEPAAPPPVAVRSTPVVQPDSILLDEEIIEEDEIEEAAAPEKEAEATDENSDEANRRRRRRRRRRGDKREDGSEDFSVENGNEASADTDAEGESASSGDEDDASAEGENGDNGDDESAERRRRRRGRRGGRRNRRDREGDEVSADSADEVGDDVQEDGAPRSVNEAAGAVKEGKNGVAVSEALPVGAASEEQTPVAPALAEVEQVVQSPVTEPVTETVVAEIVAPAPVSEVETAPAKPARRRRNTVREKAKATSEADTAADIDVPAALDVPPLVEAAPSAEAVVSEVVAETIVTETSTPAAVEPTVETAAAEVAAQPRRTGWWQRKTTAE
ncbi:Rne/Rng family ribonuclease [Castellaniella sp.]|uniref:Rne/Rng family ribonuclease n=1 Tax=Castellaniella sp. TaxID=1955812 RepID=UPI002AFE54FE|nr:Rne/Rng family ribonuclease [Castellaniella sp.]